MGSLLLTHHSSPIAHVYWGTCLLSRSPISIALCPHSLPTRSNKFPAVPLLHFLPLSSLGSATCTGTCLPWLKAALGDTCTSRRQGLVLNFPFRLRNSWQPLDCCPGSHLRGLAGSPIPGMLFPLPKGPDLARLLAFLSPHTLRTSSRKIHLQMNVSLNKIKPQSSAGNEVKQKPNLECVCEAQSFPCSPPLMSLQTAQEATGWCL